MSDTIWKYPFGLADTFSLSMPEGAEVLHVDVQQPTPCMWVRVDPSASMQTRTFHVVGTGTPIPPGAEHLGTWLQPPYVWHLFGGAP
jgi:hypothetical protein